MLRGCRRLRSIQLQDHNHGVRPMTRRGLLARMLGALALGCLPKSSPTAVVTDCSGNPSPTMLRATFGDGVRFVCFMLLEPIGENGEALARVVSHEPDDRVGPSIRVVDLVGCFGKDSRAGDRGF